MFSLLILFIKTLIWNTFWLSVYSPHGEAQSRVVMYVCTLYVCMSMYCMYWILYIHTYKHTKNLNNSQFRLFHIKDPQSMYVKPDLLDIYHRKWTCVKKWGCQTKQFFWDPPGSKSMAHTDDSEIFVKKRLQNRYIVTYISFWVFDSAK